MKDITKKLQKLAKTRKTQVVVIKKGTVKYNTKSSSTSADDYYSSGAENN